MYCPCMYMYTTAGAVLLLLDGGSGYATCIVFTVEVYMFIHDCYCSCGGFYTHTHTHTHREVALLPASQ